MGNKFGPVVSGKFYPEEREKLIDRIESCYADQYGPGEVSSPVDDELEDDLGIVAPHAGYKFSGPIAAYAYKWLAEHGRPSRVVIIGTNHSGFGPSAAIAQEGVWVTPMGEVEIDEGLARDITDKSYELKQGTAAFSREHSIEVQLPFLQHLWEELGTDFSFVPICLKDQSSAIAGDVGAAVKEAAPEGTLVVASTDFTHYESQENVEKKDRRAIESIIEMDVEGFYEDISEYGISICGYGAIASLMAFASARGLEPEELRYATSGEVSGYGEEVVGYSAIGFD